ncbi:universal stress protein [Natronomonas sp.]|uniref:universal stress protein n=1 Tax=Natronomonas sp. TaxID=2184060 RepID=UPI002FC2BF27
MTRVLVPVEILEGSSVSYGLMGLLSTMDVTVLGYQELPEQTPADQAREQFEDRAVAALGDLAEEFREAGGDADTRLVFTHDRKQTVDRVANEVDARAYAITGATGDVDRLLVPIAGDVAVDRILDFVDELVGDRDIRVTLFLASQAEGAETLLEKAADRLNESGISTETDLVVSGQPFEALIEAVPDHDAIVMGEQAPSLSKFLLGDAAERVASASVGPVLVVRSEQTAAESLGE